MSRRIKDSAGNFYRLDEVTTTRHVIVVNYDDVSDEEYTSATTPSTEDGAQGFVPIRIRWYEGLVELPAGSILVAAVLRITEPWVAPDATAVAVSAMVRSAGFEHGVTDDWVSVAVRTETGDAVADESNQETESPVSGSLGGRLCRRAVEIGIRVELMNDGEAEIPGAPTGGSLQLIVVEAGPAE